MSRFTVGVWNDFKPRGVAGRGRNRQPDKCFLSYLAPRWDDVQRKFALASQCRKGGRGVVLRSRLASAGHFRLSFWPVGKRLRVAKNVASSQIKVEDSVSMSFLAAGVPTTASWNFASFSRADRIEIFGTEGKISLSCFGSDDVRLESPRGLQTFMANCRHTFIRPGASIVDELNGQGKVLSTGESACELWK
jgi:hypothetical protein